MSFVFFFLPSLSAVVQVLPLMETGKVFRRRLEKMALQVLAERRKRAGADERLPGLLGELQALTARVLGLDTNGGVPVTTPLVDLGLTSLQAVELRAQLDADDLVDLDRLELLSLEDVAELVDRQGEGLTPAVVVPERDVRDQLKPLDPHGGLTLCAAGDAEGLARLLEGGTWDPRFMVDRHGSTALMWAAGNGHVQAVQVLLRHAPDLDVNQVNKEGRSAAVQAARHGQLETLRLLAEHGADFAQKTSDNSTVFHWALNGGSLPVLEYLAAHPAVDLAAQNDFGK